MKSIYFYILLILPIWFCKGQDSLVLSYHNLTSDSSRLAYIYKIVDEYSSISDSITLYYLKEYEQLAKRLNNTKAQASVQRRYGLYAFRKQQYVKAIEFHNKALELDLSISAFFSVVSDYCNIGDIYLHIKEYDRAIELYELALETYKVKLVNIKFPYGRGFVQYLLSRAYLLKGDLDLSNHFNKQALVNCKRKDNTNKVFNIRRYQSNQIVNIYILQAKIQQKRQEADLMKASLDSMEYYINTFKLNNQRIDYNYLSEVYSLETKNECCADIELTLRGLKKEKLYSTILNYYHLLKQSSVKQDNKDLALLYADSIYRYQSLIYNQDKTHAIVKYQSEFETKKAEYETREALLEAENQKQRVFIISGLTLGLLIVLIFILFTLQTKKKSHRQALSLKDLKIDELLRENELENLQGLLAGQEVERKRIAQDLHDTIGGMLATIKLHFNALGKSKKLEGEYSEIFSNANHLLDESCVELRRVSHDLNKASIASYGIKENLITLKNALELTSEVVVNLIVDELDLSSSSKIEKELFKVIQELLSNTLKHAQATEINIQLSQFEDELQLIFEDNGIGFNVNKITRGLGLNSIQKRITKIQGTLTIDSHEKSGTTFIFEIPIP